MLRRHTSFAESLRVAQQTWSLSARQLEVLACVAAGDANKAIATKLDCTERTVESHVTNLMRATSTQCRTELAARFLTLR
jgi:two-component system nitrate/nitrite response regulator NarL